MERLSHTRGYYTNIILHYQILRKEIKFKFLDRILYLLKFLDVILLL